MKNEIECCELCHFNFKVGQFDAGVPNHKKKYYTNPEGFCFIVILRQSGGTLDFLLFIGCPGWLPPVPTKD